MTAARTMAMAAVMLTTLGAAPAGAFDQTLVLHGVSFRVTCANDTPRPTLTITPSKLTIDNSPMRDELDGHVVGAEVADLNADGSPEIYVFVGPPGTTTRRSVVAYAANQRKSLSAIYLPAVADDARAVAGYRGGDEVSIVKGSFVRRFAVYRDGDADGHPTGGRRQVEYTLARGEASWVFKTRRVSAY